MFLKKINNLGNTLLFRLTVLHTIAFTLLAIVSFAVFYYRIYSVTMERMDEELLEETEQHDALLADSGLAGIRSKMAEESEFEDPTEEFYRCSILTAASCLRPICGPGVRLTKQKCWPV